MLTKDQTRTKFSRTIEPAVKVPSGSVIEVFTHEATGGQLNPKSTVDDLANVDWDRIHTLTGPVYVEGAEPGDVLAVRLIELEPADWRWMTIEPGFGFLASEFEKPCCRSLRSTLRKARSSSRGIGIPLKPFAGVMGVAPDPTRC